MNKIVSSLATLLLLTFSANTITAQQTTTIVEPATIPGEILVQLNQGEKIQTIIRDLQKFNQKETGIEVKKLVSQHMRTWLIEFDETTLNSDDFLIEVYRHPAVQVAQFNHIVTNRATPNDTQFSSQWQYINTGAGGGTAGADIDADLAWDITTGGLTPLGDTIVACVIDDGIDLGHADFGNNLWVNHDEIPMDNYDNDNNGFVDDYMGWNADDGNDDIEGGFWGGGHGTPVAGIVGAIGNNGIGVAGVNWDVKLMIVVGGGNEADAIAAYAYPLALRKRYNETNGAEGAFVVSTNASWGIDFGQPADAPLWCAMYDTLGKYLSLIHI